MISTRNARLRTGLGIYDVSDPTKQREITLWDCGGVYRLTFGRQPILQTGCSKSEAGSSPRRSPPGGEVGEAEKRPRGEGVLPYDHDIARTGLRDRISRSV